MGLLGGGKMGALRIQRTRRTVASLASVLVAGAMVQADGQTIARAVQQAGREP